MEKNPVVLVVGSDPSLRPEFQAAVAGIRNARLVVHYAGDYRQGIETARSRRPDLVCVAMERDVKQLKAFAEEIGIVAPEATITAIYHRDAFGADESESSMLIDAMRSRVQDFLRRPLSSHELQQVLDRLVRRGSEAPRARLGTVVSFISNKGGVGKSTLSVNVACALAARHPDKVLLVDASLQLGVCASLLDLNPTTSILDAVREKDRVDETMIRQLAVQHSSGVRLLAAPNDAVEAAEVHDDAIARVLTLARRAYEFVIVDTFPMLDSVVMAILDLSDITYVVFQGTVPSVAGTARLVKVLEGLGIPAARQRAVLSHNYASFSGDLKPGDVVERFGRDIDHVVPYHKRVLVATNSGVPYALSATKLFGFGKAIERIAEEIEARTSAASLEHEETSPPDAPHGASSNDVPSAKSPVRV